jgi:hypothetical protein
MQKEKEKEGGNTFSLSLFISYSSFVWLSRERREQTKRDRGEMS